GLLAPEQRRGRNEPYTADVVIASGTAATAETYKVVGLMDEDLYIDFVDVEWCLRCRQKRVPIYVVPAASMEHLIGNRVVDLWLMKVFVHILERCYYQIRNCFILLRRKHVLIALVITEMGRVVAHRLVLLFFVSQKRLYLANYF